MSSRFKLDKLDVKSIGKVIGWTVLSALVALGLDVFQVIEVSGSALYFLPIINTVLVGLQKLLKDNKPAILETNE